MMTHRLQILLDEERYQRVALLAKQRKTSVASVIREAIDRGLPTTDPRRREAAFRRIMDAPDMPVPEDPADLKKEIYEGRWSRFE